ncbi:diacylglycerol kinase [Bailinhaonella thermotolerans]|uniref:Diacylglycerol kinase n=1 Tax=Bailinhaonella thermotolerans TaxID=1070861 RepID=A0A3A4B5Q7_9ACTN|nr:diacylglycerol kinase [Bailinhaonella thermotolerans]RJL35960.1 diacylglycerol kinase [Bailinhaonella thermotolerans]
MAREIAVLVNPSAGGGRGLRLLAPLVRALRARGAEVSVLRGHDPGETLELACMAVAEHCEALVVLGGDGLAHLALQAVAGTDTPLGIIPAGTGNDIAAALGVPVRDPAAAARIVSAGHVRELDAARIRPQAGDHEGEWFLSVAACGFDARVNERANRMAFPRGRARYAAATLAELARLRPIPYTITLDGEKIETEAALVAVGNTSMYGGGMRVCPAARPDDGLLDVCVIKAGTAWDLVRNFPRIYTGTHTSHPSVTTYQARHVALEAPGVIAYADGERITPAPLTCTVVPGVVKVLTPA